MNAYLLLEDGTRYGCTILNAEVCSDITVIGELVFNNVVVGFQELLTDPSCVGQAVCLTYPLVGNCGANSSDYTGERVYPTAVVAREICDTPSNFKMEERFGSFLARHGTIVITGVDTRALTRHLRDNGTMKAAVVRGEGHEEKASTLIKQYKNGDLIAESTVKEKREYKAGNARYNVSALDLGICKDIIKALNDRGCNVALYPCSSGVEELFEPGTGGILIAGGSDSGDSNEIYTEKIKEIMKKDIPVLGISSGHLFIDRKSVV